MRRIRERCSLNPCDPGNVLDRTNERLEVIEIANANNEIDHAGTVVVGAGLRAANVSTAIRHRRGHGREKARPIVHFDAQSHGIGFTGVASHVTGTRR